VTADHAVVIAGAGPTGLMVAGELALAGIDVVIVERRTDQQVDGSRAGGLHARTIEVLDQRGIADRFLSAGQVMQVQGFAGIPLDISDFPTRHNHGLALWQSRFEPILAGWVAELGVPVIRGREVVGVTQDDSGVTVEVSDGSVVRAAYVVGCDGGRSLVRRAAGIEFVGTDASTSWMIAEVDMAEEPELGFRHDRVGTHALGRAADGQSVRVVLTEPDLDHTRDPSIDDLRAALVTVYGTDFELRSASWISRFTDMTRQAVAYRSGRVLVAGDAAHVHPPHGGQGLNTGVQDAVNLGWKLAQVVNGISSERLLDTYHAERHPVGARVLHNTLAQVALATADVRHDALRDIMTDLLRMDGPRRHVAGMLSGLDIRYDLGGGHPLVGRRMPDLDLVTAAGTQRVAELLHQGRPVVLTVDGANAVDLGGWTDQVQVVAASYEGAWVLPVVGPITAPQAVLIRPDGHVAWAGQREDPGLQEALITWCGEPGGQASVRW
jgi:3-(3-hydroxy-phenyl)propionate hydroxylase